MSDQTYDPMFSSPPGMTPGPVASSSRGCLYTAARVLAAILAVVFVLATPAVLFAFNLERIAFNPNTYKQALTEVGFYDNAPTLVAGLISDSVEKNPQDNKELASLSRSDIQDIATALIPQGWVKEQTDSVIDQLFAWLASDEPVLRVQVSLTAVKKEFAGPAGTKVLQTVINSWPECTTTQIAAAAAAIQAGNMSRLPTCKPPASLIPEMTPYLGQLAAQGSTSIPDTVDLASPNGVPARISPQDDPRPNLRLYRGVMLFSPILPALLMVAIVILAVRSWKNLAYWMGIPLVIAAILGALVAFLMLPVRDMVVQGLAGQGPILAASIEDVLKGVVGVVFRTVALWIGGESVVLGGAGLVLLVGGFMLSRTPKPAEPMM